MSDWYAQIAPDDHSLQQGDILEEFPIVIADLDALAVQAVIRGNAATPSADILVPDVIVLTQSCDIENDKIETIVVCPVSDFELWVSQTGGNSKQRKKTGDDARKGRMAGIYRLMHEPEFELKERIVDFRTVYAPSKRLVRDVVRAQSKQRYRYIGEPRASLAKAFGDFFARVALPDPP